MTRADARRLLLAPLSLPVESSACSDSSSTHTALSSLPPAFDARTQWPNLFHASPDPGMCLAVPFVSATIFSDVISIKFNTAFTFSTQELFSCANYTCISSGWPNSALVYMTEKGLPSEACLPLSDSSQAHHSHADTDTDTHARARHTHARARTCTRHAHTHPFPAPASSHSRPFSVQIHLCRRQP